MGGLRIIRHSFLTLSLSLSLFSFFPTAGIVWNGSKQERGKEMRKDGGEREYGGRRREGIWRERVSARSMAAAGKITFLLILLSLYIQYRYIL
jgi:hypothetical protein